MTSQLNSARTALVVGATGITGLSLTSHLVRNDWQVLGLARKPQASPGVTPISADLQNSDSIRAALKDQKITDIFLNVWSRQANEAENVRVNGDMLRNLFSALPADTDLQHISLVTGTKQYLGPFESYGQTSAETPFREDTPRLPGLNFYYTQEDIVFEEAAKRNATWNVHRPHTVIGYARGNAMNMGTTLAVYATLCREAGEPFIFPGSHLQWNALTDVTDARILAQHLEWAALTPAAHNEAFNIVNGDTFRWRWLWPQIASYFGIEPQDPPDPIAPLDQRMEKAAGLWKTIAAKHNLAEDNIDKLVSWWHTDGDLGRQLECVNDMTKSRLLGFTAVQPTPQSFFDLFDELKKDGTIPA